MKPDSQSVKTYSAIEAEERIIRPKTGFVPVDFPELWRYRELLLFFTWKNILIRYKQTVLGILWAIIQPIVTMIIFTVIFGKIGNFPSNDMPYSVMTLTAILPWQFFASALSQGSGSVVSAGNMVQKVYFPRLYIPASQVLSCIVDFLVSFVILLVMMWWLNVPFRIEMLLLPVFFSIAFVAALGASMFFSALNVKYRDIGHVMPFLVRTGMFVSPVGFMSSVVPVQWRLLYSLNPIVGVIDGFRWAIFGDKFAPYWPGFWASLVVALLIFLVGLFYFRNMEKTFADIV